MPQDNLVQHLREAFPDLEDRYQERVKFWKGERAPSSYGVLGAVLRPALDQDLKKGHLTEFVRRAALFIEEICDSHDREAVNVVWIGIFEWLIFNPKELHLFWPVLGQETKANLKDAARRWSEAGRRFGKTKGLPEEFLPEE